MTKLDLVDHLTYKCGLHRSSAITAVNGIIDAISSALIDGQPVTIRGFATIKPADAPQRTARNISTGASVIVPAHRTVKFIISKELKSRLNVTMD